MLLNTEDFRNIKKICQTGYFLKQKLKFSENVLRNIRKMLLELLEKYLQKQRNIPKMFLNRTFSKNSAKNIRLFKNVARNIKC